MINLLSPIDKKELHAARRNTVWSRYTFLVLALLVGVNIILGFSIFYIQSQARMYQDKITANQELSNRQYSGTKLKAETFRKDLATAKTILEGETNYSKVILDITHTVPAGCVMSSLTLSSTSFDIPQSLSFNCKNSADILRLKTTLEKNTATFDKVNIVSTSINSTVAGNLYPISINMSLVLKKPSTGEGAGS
jgi:hypothetical protein